MTIKLEAGSKLSRIELPPIGTRRREFRIGDGCTGEIVVDQLPGPMGFYAVAIIKPDKVNLKLPAGCTWADWPDTAIPLHMAESFDVIQ